MIARIWHGRTSTADAEKYRDFVIETGIKDYKSVKGNLGAQIWQRQEGDITHIWTISWWDSYESIKQFAGNDFEKAKYYEEDTKYLLEFEPNVMHCTCYDFKQE
jgi:heme-degrading monooxygenase HmoA